VKIERFISRSSRELRVKALERIITTHGHERFEVYTPNGSSEFFASSIFDDNGDQVVLWYPVELDDGEIAQRVSGILHPTIEESPSGVKIVHDGSYKQAPKSLSEAIIHVAKEFGLLDASGRFNRKAAAVLFPALMAPFLGGCSDDVDDSQYTPETVTVPPVQAQDTYKHIIDVRTIPKDVAWPKPEVERNTEHRSIFRPYQRELNTIIMHEAPLLDWQVPLINSLPEYTNVLMLAENERFARRITKALDDGSLTHENITLVVYHVDNMRKWAQDIGETISTNRGNQIIVPAYYIDGNKKRSNDGFVSALQMHGINARQANVYFEGGNVTFDRFNGEDILFVGQGNFAMAQGYGDQTTEDEAVDRLKHEFNVDRVEVMARGQYGTPVWHLDLAFVITGPGEVAVMDLDYVTDEYVKQLKHDLGKKADEMSEKWDFLDLEEPGPTADFFYHYRNVLVRGHKAADTLQKTHDILQGIQTQFEEMGYQVHRLKMDPWQLLLYQSYANSTPFINKETGERSILVPIFPNRDGEFEGELPGNTRALDFFKDLGLTPTPVKNQTFPLMGSAHCLLKPYK
jgi:hypothetical protein